MLGYMEKGIQMIRWIRTSRLSMKNSLSLVNLLGGMLHVGHSTDTGETPSSAITLFTLPYPDISRLLRALGFGV